jgi:hypothetical protein
LNIAKISEVTTITLGLCGLAIFFILGPTFGLGLHVDRYNDQRGGQVILLCLVGLVLVWQHVLQLRYAHHQKIREEGLAAYLVIIALLFGLVAAICAEHPVHSLQEWGLWVLLVALAAWVATVPLSVEKAFDWFIGLLFVGILFYTALALISFFIELSVLKEFSTSFLWTVGFENQRFLTAYLSIQMPLFACAWRLERWHAARPFLVLIGSFTLLVCVMAQSRGVLLFFLGASLAFGLVSLTCLKSWLRFITLCSICGLLLGIIMFWLPTQLGWQLEIVGQRKTLEDLVTLSSREVLWRDAWRAFLESYGLGIGPMMLASRLNGGLGAHPHNIYLQALAEWGAVTFVCAVGAGAKGLHAIYVRKSKDGDGSLATLALQQQRSALFATYCGLASFSLVDGFWVYPLTGTLACILVGLGVKLDRGNYRDVFAQTDTKKLHYVYKHLVIILLTVGSIGILMRLVPAQLLDISDEQRAYYESHREERFNPRFWVQGWIYWERQHNAK